MTLLIKCLSRAFSLSGKIPNHVLHEFGVYGRGVTAVSKSSDELSGIVQVVLLAGSPVAPVTLIMYWRGKMAQQY